jgi:hypothetical protein
MQTSLSIPNSWIVFLRKVSAACGGLQRTTLVQFASSLRKQKHADTWTDDAIRAALPAFKMLQATRGESDAEKSVTCECEDAPDPACLIPEPEVVETDNAHDEKQLVSELKVLLCDANNNLALVQKQHVEATNAAQHAQKDLDEKRSFDVAAVTAVTAAQAKLDEALLAAKATKDARAQARAMLERVKKDCDTLFKSVTCAQAECTKLEQLHVNAVEANMKTHADKSGASVMPMHERRKQIPKHVKTLVWNKYIGEEVASATCTCCRSTQISVRHFHCGHVIAESVGGNTNVNNLRPICAACNSSMGTQSMNEFSTEFFGWTM